MRLRIYLSGYNRLRCYIGASVVLSVNALVDENGVPIWTDENEQIVVV